MKQMKFKTIILIAVSIIMTFFMGIFVICASKEYRQSIQEENYSITNFYIRNVLKDVDNLFQNFSNISYLAFSTPEFTERCKIHYTLSPTEQSISHEIFSEAAAELLVLQNELSSVVLYDTEYREVFSLHHYTTNHNSMFARQLSVNQDLISSILAPADKKAYGNTSYGFFTYKGYSNKLPSYVYSVRKLRTFQPHEDAGYLVLIAPVAELTSIFTSDTSISNILFLNDQNRIVYESSGAWIGYTLDEYNSEISNVFTEKQNDYYEITQDGKQMLVSGQESSYSGWKVVTMQETETVYYTANKVTSLLVILFIFMLIVTLIFIMVFISYITKPLVIMSSYLHAMDLNNPGEKMQHKVHSKELFILTEAYNTMLEKIKTMLENEYKAVIREKEYHLSLLQMQIQPHFLYNTLDTIRMSALINHDQPTADMILELSDFFRRSITSEQIILLEDEFAQMTSYLSLLQMRYTNLETQISLDEHLRYVEIPSFILQPLVENAFNHGLKPHGCIGCIWVTAQIISDAAFEIIIQDNGDGTSEETIQQLNQKLNHLSDEKIDNYSVSNIGLLNISWRLYNFYKEQVHICVGNHEQGGFFIRITITEPGFKSIKELYPNES